MNIYQLPFFSKRKKFGFEVDSSLPVCDGPVYTDVLSTIHQIIKPDWYLEIGSRSGTSLTKCESNFIAIDPEFAISAPVFNTAKRMIFCQQASDDFFETDFLAENNISPCLAFIDGMHLFEFALRDFINCEKSMKRNSAICFHDVLPFNVPMTTRDLDYVKTDNRPWTGDVWKTMAILLKYRPDLKIKIIDSKKTGLAYVSNLDSENTILEENYSEITDEYLNMSFSNSGYSEYYDLFKVENTETFLLDLKQQAATTSSQ